MSKAETYTVKGISILLIFFIHLYSFPERLAGGGLNYIISVFDMPLITLLGDFGRIGLYSFFFISGYGIFKSSQTKGMHLISRIKKLYFTYWKVFLIFIPIAFLFFRNQPVYCANESICTKYKTFIWAEFLSNLLGISDTYNPEWWYFRTYLISLLTFPFVKSFIEKHSSVINIFSLFVATILISSVFPALADSSVLGRLSNNFLYETFLCQSVPYTAFFWAGSVLAKDDLLMQLREVLRSCQLSNVFFDTGIILAIIFFVYTGIRELMFLLYVPVFIAVALDLVKRWKFADKVLSQLGMQSANIWLIHSFLLYYFYPFAKIITCTRYAVPSLIILTIFSYISAIAVNYIWKFVDRICTPILNHISK